MPTYEYQCEHCGHIFEKYQSFKDKPLQNCPKCQGKVKRIIHPVGIVFKGQGFYKTDKRNTQKNSTATKKEPLIASDQTSSKNTTPKSKENKTNTKENNN